MLVPTIGKGFAYALRVMTGGAILPSATHCQEAIKQMVDFISLYSAMTEDMVRDLTDEVYQQFFQSNHGAFPMAKCLQHALENRNFPLDKKSESLVMVVHLHIAKIMCNNLESTHWTGHRAGVYIERAYWLAQAIYDKDRIASRRLMRIAGKSLSGEFVDAFFWRLQSETKGKIGSMIEDLLESLAEGMLKANRPVEVLGQYLRHTGRRKKVSDTAVAVFEQRSKERSALRSTPEPRLAASEK